MIYYYNNFGFSVRNHALFYFYIKYVEYYCHATLRRQDACIGILSLNSINVCHVRKTFNNNKVLIIASNWDFKRL